MPRGIGGLPKKEQGAGVEEEEEGHHQGMFQRDRERYHHPVMHDQTVHRQWRTQAERGTWPPRANLNNILNYYNSEPV